MQILRLLEYWDKHLEWKALHLKLYKQMPSGSQSQPWILKTAFYQIAYLSLFLNLSFVLQPIRPDLSLKQIWQIIPY